jgi:hypothetical protein
MFDTLEGLVNNFDRALFLLKVIAALLAAAVAAYVARTVFGPLAQVVRWMFGNGEIAAGVAHGARLLAWAAVIGLGLWLWLGEPAAFVTQFLPER